MRLTGLRALTANSWVLLAVAFLGLAEDFVAWGFGTGGSFPHLRESMGFAACGSALIHIRGLLEQRPSPVAAPDRPRADAPR